MSTITFKGKAVQTNNHLPDVGESFSDFILVDGSLNDVSLSHFGKKKKILNIFPSLDTDVCAASVRAFHEKLKGRNDVVVLNISMDLPFAQRRFCTTEGLDHVVTLSAFRSSFPTDHGLMMVDGPLTGLCSRVAFVLDENNKIIYKELVPEITQEPDYASVVAALEP
ncbi:MAG: thiol peroxidase [Chlamydiales bacterium]|nr:thiol peroxidase [Chlamydiia bacterium]MCP5507909.1 thiol peroxidase [Chlamydiales bacterium]